MFGKARKRRGPRGGSISKIEVTRHDLFLPGLPAILEDASIVQLSDLHRGCGGTDALIEAAIGHANLLEPDYLFLTGDFADGPKGDILPVVKMVSGLRARRGIYAVLGNHDQRGDPVLMRSALEAAGITVLENTAQPLEEGFWIAGIDDLREGPSDLPAALASLPQDRPAILLSHDPVVLDRLPEERPLVILSGHTHGGQIVLPFPTPAMICRIHLKTPFVHGWYHRGKLRMYVNRGIGVTGAWPLARRINCLSEITQLRLRRAPVSETEIGVREGTPFTKL